MIVSTKLKNIGVKITAKGNYTQERVINCGDGAVLAKYYSGCEQLEYMADVKSM